MLPQNNLNFGHHLKMSYFIKSKERGTSKSLMRCDCYKKATHDLRVYNVPTFFVTYMRYLSSQASEKILSVSKYDRLEYVV